MLLRSHNKETYKQITKLFLTRNRVAAVQPMGTGKSFLILQLANDNPEKEFIIASPSDYISLQIKTHAENNGVSLNNCTFLTYSKLSQMSEKELGELKADFIVLDEFHRCGAPKWNAGVNSLLALNPDSKVLGTSATPIRYLDSMRNMAEELFDNCYAVNMTLSEAIRKGILPMPVYVTALYSFSEDIGRLQKRADMSGNDYLKHKLYAKIQKAKGMISELDCGIDKIFCRHMSRKSGKYIVFCTDTERLHTAYDEAAQWFLDVNQNIHKYSVYSQNSTSSRQFVQFCDDNDPTALKLLFSVNMLNEGVHIDGIDGVIMLRATKSANVFYQQLGRALSCSSGKSPVIFDVVNNFETGDTAGQYTEIMSVGRENGYGDELSMSFEIYDYVRDIRSILDELNRSFAESWSMVYEVLGEYIGLYGISPAYNEEYNGYRLGMWCSNQRILRKKGMLSEEQIEKLDKLGFIWNAKNERWEKSYAEAVRYKKEHGSHPSRTASDESTKMIYQWISNQKQAYKKGTLSEQRVQKMLKLGIVLEVQSDDELWEMKYSMLKKFYEKEKRLPVLSDTVDNNEVYTVYRWMTKQKDGYKKHTLSKERIEKLSELNFVWDRADDLWERRFSVLTCFVKENGRPPKAQEKYDGDTIGQWYNKQLKYISTGKLDMARAERLKRAVHK